MRNVSLLFHYPRQSVILNIPVADCPGCVAEFAANLSERSAEFVGLYIHQQPDENADDWQAFCDSVSTLMIQSQRFPFVCLRNPGEILLILPASVSLALLLFV